MNIDMNDFGPCATIDKYSLDSLKREKAYELAAEMGCVVKLPAANELFLDLDGEEEFEAFKAQYLRFSRMVVSIQKATVTPSKSGEPGKYHVVLTLDRDISPLERILFQLMLASDRTREILSFARYVNGDANPTLFYEKVSE